MAISEVSVRDATLLAIEQINAAGGIMGRELVPVVEDSVNAVAMVVCRARSYPAIDAKCSLTCSA